MDNKVQYFRRKEAGVYLKDKYGFGAAKTLAKLASVSSDGPVMVYAGNIPLYSKESLDSWALSKLSDPVRSTSERSSTQDPLGARAGSVG
jgi:hypothetical protein